MKHYFLWFIWCTGMVIANFDVDFFTGDLGSIVTRRHSRPAVLPPSYATKDHQKRGISNGPSPDQQVSAKGGQKNKKTAVQRSKQQQGKVVGASPSQSQGRTDGLQAGKEKGKASGQKPGELPKTPGIPPQAGNVRAEVSLKGPGEMVWERGSQMQDAPVAAGARDRRVAVHHEHAGAGASSHGRPPPNAVIMPASQHPIQVNAQGPIGGASFIIPAGGRVFASADIPGRSPQTWDIQGPEQRGVRIDPLCPGDVKVHASGTQGCFVQASGSSRTYQSR